MASITAGLTNMGTVTSEESTKDAGLFSQAMPGADSNDTILLDMFGASRQMVIKGKFVIGDTGYAAIGGVNGFIAALDALISGAQTSRVYNSDKTGLNYTGLVSSVTWSASEGDVNSVDYTIVFMQGST